MNLVSGFHIVRRRLVGMATKQGMFGVMSSKPLLELAARRNYPGLAARLLAWQVEPVCEAKGPGKLVVALTLPKSGFAEDVEESVIRDGRFRVLRLHRKALKVIANCFFGHLVDDNNYNHDDPKITARKLAYREFMIEVCRRLARRLDLDVVLTANFSFYAEQEFAAAMEHIGVPLIAMHKECIKSPGVEAFYEATYRDRKTPFQGRLITTYNEVERGIQINAGVAPADRIVATGAPRLDRFHRYRREHAGQDRSQDGRPTVLFMSFNEKSGCPVLGRRGDDRFETLPPEMEKINWANLTRNCHAAMIRLAQDYPDIRVIVKSKNHVLALQALTAGMGEGFEPPENLQIVVGGNSFDLIVSADVLCTINSGSLFEALAANVDVVSPDFDEAVAPLTAPFMVDLGSAATHAHSVDELISILAEKARSRPSRLRSSELNEASRATLAYWVNNADGKAGERASRTIMEVVEANRAKATVQETTAPQELSAVGD